MINTKKTVSITLKNKQKIVATEDHEVYYEGGWHNLKHLIQLWHETKLENNTKLQQIPSIKSWFYSFNELQKNWKDKGIKACLISRRIFKDCFTGRFRGISFGDCSQDGYVDIRYLSRWKRNKSQERNKDRQQFVQPRMGHKVREYISRIQKWIREASERFSKWNVKIKRLASIGNKEREKELWKVLWEEKFSKKVQCFRKSDKRHCVEEVLVSHIKLQDIDSVDYVKEKYVYDITVEDAHNYYLDCGKPILVHNSSKTYSLAQLFALRAIERKDGVFTICRKTLPSLKASAYRDYIEVLRSLDVFNEANLNKSELIYRIGNSETEFISVDEPQKIRGRKRVDLWINEANELTYEDFRQLLLRTTGQVFLDYNPSDEFHWIYEHVLPREDCEFIQSTYLDNPFLEASIIKEIELLKDVDPNYWKIYGLGERGVSESKVYSNWDLCDEFQEGCDIIYGLDFGYNNETALVRVGIKEKDIYVQELIYEKHLTNADLINKIKELDIKGLIFADSAEPQRIEELLRAGISVRPTIKDGKVKLGIDLMKTYKIHVTKDSVNGQKEIRSYSWKTDRDGKVLDEPVKVNDHWLDATRYAVYTYAKQPVPSISWA